MSATTSRPRSASSASRARPPSSASPRATAEPVLRPAQRDRGAERFIRTLKENLLWVRRFETVEELRLALIAFRQTYNRTWIIERHGYKTPAQVRADQSDRMPMAA